MGWITDEFERVGQTFAADTETALAPLSYKGWEHVRLFQAHSDNHSFYIDLQTLDDWDREEFKTCIESEDLHIIWQNAAFDLRVLMGMGILPKGTFDDTMHISNLLTNGQQVPKGFLSHNSLEAIAWRELGVKLDKSLQAQNWMTAELTKADMAYAMNDVKCTWEAWKKMKPKLEERGLIRVYRTELNAILPTVLMERNGIYLNREVLDEIMVDLDATRKTSLTTFVEELDTELQHEGAEPLPKHPGTLNINLNKKESGSVAQGTKQYAGFNPGSSQQLLKRFADIGIDPTDPRGKPSVDKKWLASYTHRSIVRTYLSWKKADKHLQMAQGLVAAQAEDGRIYGRFNQIGTFTGRYSSSKPNLQQIPRGEMRRAFTAPSQGRVIGSADYSGMELRALCSPFIADEKAMAHTFATGGDVHRETARAIFQIPNQEKVSDEQRQQSKAINFGLAYGSSAQGLVNYLQTKSIFLTLKEGEEYRNRWLAKYPKIASWHNHCRELCDGEAVVYMVDGRRRTLTGEARKHTVMANNIVQGSCASAMKMAMTSISTRIRKIDPTAKVVAQVHDEIVFECIEERAEEILKMVLEAMEWAGAQIFGTAVPLTAEGGFGPSWGEAKA